jgi:hypothetical protein
MQMAERLGAMGFECREDDHVLILRCRNCGHEVVFTVHALPAEIDREAAEHREARH